MLTTQDWKVTVNLDTQVDGTLMVINAKKLISLGTMLRVIKLYVKNGKYQFC